jgi:hypothetical protein
VPDGEARSYLSLYKSEPVLSVQVKWLKGLAGGVEELEVRSICVIKGQAPEQCG